MAALKSFALRSAISGVSVTDLMLASEPSGSPLRTILFDWRPSTTVAGTDLLAAENEALKADLKRERARVEFLLKRLDDLENLAAGIRKPKPIEGLAQRLRSLSGGTASWRQAEADRLEEHKDAVESGKMSKIKYHRLLKKMDQKTLANALRTKQSNISRLEKPGYQPRIGTLEKLAKALAVNITDLLPRKP